MFSQAKFPPPSGQLPPENKNPKEDESTRTAGSIVGGAILGGSLGGPIGALIGAAIGGILASGVNETERKDGK